MLDLLYFAGQVLCLVGLAYGALLAIGASASWSELSEARFAHRRRKDAARRVAEAEDPHVSSLGYWP